MTSIIKIPRSWAYIMCAILIGWGAFTVILFVKYKGAQKAWRYKQLYEESRAQYQQYYDKEDIFQKAKSFLTSSQVLTAKMSFLRDGEAGKKVNPLNSEGHTIIVIFSGFDCTACVQRELLIWEDFYKKHIDLAKVIGIAITSDPQDMWEQVRALVTFPTFLADKHNSMIKALRIPHSPTVLLVDNETRKIKDVHFGEFRKDQESLKFQKQVIKELSTSQVSLR